MRKQRFLGAAMAVLSWVAMTLAAMGPTPEERDTTAALVILLLGLYLIFGKEDLIT